MCTWEIAKSSIVRSKSMIGIYFSGTGNTKFCLSQFLGNIGTDIPMYSITDQEVVAAISDESDIVFAYPVYYSNLPKIVFDYIKNNESLWAGKNIFVIATMGLFSGDGAGVLARLLKKHGANILGGLHLKMPDCIGDEKVLKKSFEENKATIAATCIKIQKSAEQYLANKPTKEGLGFWYHVAGLFGQRFYFMNKTKKYVHNPKINREKCVGCGICKKVCPMNNVQIEANKAVPGNRCTLCYSCFAHCPKQAITILGKKVIEQHTMEKYL